jgi:hypothetical protein
LDFFRNSWVFSNGYLALTIEAFRLFGGSNPGARLKPLSRKSFCIWVKVDYAAESKSPYENYFDPSSSFNLCVAVSVRCRSASSARNLYHFRKRSVPKPQHAQFLSRNSSVSFRIGR